MATSTEQPIKLGSLWPLLLPLLIFLPGLSGFPYPDALAKFSDIAISHYPNAVFLKQTLLETGSIPWWSPTILSGYPFVASPLSGIWYPPGWLALLLPLPLGFNLLALIHIIWGGLGMYILLRVEGLSHRAGLLGALAFEWLPKVFAHYGAGHLTLVYAVTWTPWLLISGSTNSFFRRRTMPYWANSGLILALVFLADPRWAAIAGLLWIGCYFAYSQKGIDKENRYVQKKGDVVFSRLKTGLHRLGIPALVLQIALALLLSGPLFFPLLEYTKLSTRASLEPGELFVHSLPPMRLLGLIFPDWGGTHEWVLYPGGVVLVFSLLATLNWKSNSKIKFWFWVLLISLVYALGSNLQILSYVTLIPGLSLIRVPSRSLFITGTAFSVLAAYGFEALLKVPVTLNRRGINLTLAALTSFVLILTLGFHFLLKDLLPNMIWGAGMVLVSVLGVAIVVRKQVPTKIWFVALVGLALIDWAQMNLSVLEFRPSAVVLAEQQAIAQYLDGQAGLFRVYSPSYSLPQQTSVRFDIELADGVEPLQLTTYTNFMEAATGVPRHGYGVTLPPFKNGNPTIDNVGYLPDPFLLGLLNVRFVAAEYDLLVDNLIFREQFGQTRLYENTLVRPRAWVQAEEEASNVVYQEAMMIEHKPNKIALLAEGPGLLLLSEISYPGWKVAVDGTPTPLLEAYGLLRAVPLESGEHEIQFIYRPVSVYVGLVGFCLGCFVWIKTISHRRKTSDYV